MSRALIAALALFVAGCVQGPFTLESSVASVHVDLDPFRLTVRDAKGLLVLESMAPSDGGPYGSPAMTVDRFEEVPQLLPGWDGYVAHEQPWVQSTRARVAYLNKSRVNAELVLPFPGGEMNVDVSVDGARVHLSMSVRSNPKPDFNKVTMAFALQKDEHFFGLGERYASVDHRGLSLYNWAEEGGLGRGENVPRGPMNPSPNGPSMTYFPVPFFLSSAGYGFWVKDSARTELHLGSEQPDAWRLAENADGFEATIYVHDDPKETLADYTEDTGRAYIPAPWVFGPRRRIDLGQTVNGVDEWRLLRQKGVPTTVIDDDTHFLPHGSQRGREIALATWVQMLHGEGFKVTAYNNPFVSASDPMASPELTVGTADGYFLHEPSGDVALTVLISGELQNVATVDLTNPDAADWYRGLLHRTVAMGYDGWMHDFGEYVGRSWISRGGRGDLLHNLYPVLSAKAAFDVLSAEKPNDFLFYVRSGYSGTQRWVPEVWGGDPEATFDETQGMPAMLRGGLNLGLSGVPYWGSDISGFKCLTDAPRDKEVYLRWAELGAVSTSMHDDNACSNPLGHREKWTLWSDDETTRVYGDMARLHTRLNPYFMVLARDARDTGLPAMRHPFLYAWHASSAWSVEDAFFLGPGLYAAPVVRRGQTMKSIALPRGVYVDRDQYAVYVGNESLDPVEVPAPLDKLPLLFVGGQIVPMLDASIETLAPAKDPEVVTLEQVSDRLDAVVVLSAGTPAAQIDLIDGTHLEARTATDAGNVSDLMQVSAGTLGDCASCFAMTSTGARIDRWRVNTAMSEGSALRIGPLDLTVASSPHPRRVRWDVLLVR
jgi:alpha-glucosidase (family GH31 glycosyl hydrolase)